MYVHNAIDNTLTVAGTSFFALEDTLPATLQPVDYAVLLGAQLFHSADNPMMSKRNALSCATCHYDGLSDGQVWRGLNTPTLFNLTETAPYTWEGAWQTLDSLDVHIRSVQAGSGVGINSIELAALIAYLAENTPPANPHEQDEALVRRGAQIFEETGCAACHTGETGSDHLVYDTGTGGAFVTPALYGLWLSAPYFHHGRAETLREVFTTGQGVHRLPLEVLETDIDALIAYLLQRD